MAELSLEFSQRLKNAMEMAGFNQAGLAEKIKVRQSSVSKYCNGGVPEWHILVRLSEELNLSIDYLLTGKGPATAPKGEPKATPEEQAVLNDALEVLRAHDVPGAYDKLLADNIRGFKRAIDTQRKLKSPRQKAKIG